MKIAAGYVILPFLLIVLQVTAIKTSDEIRFKVCTASELRREVNHVCMRIGTRNAFSNPSYGSLGSAVFPDTIIPHYHGYDLSDDDLIEIVKRSRPYSRWSTQDQRARFEMPSLRSGRRSSASRIDRRSMSDDMSEDQLCEYLSSCCNRSCVISQQDLAPYCSEV